MSFGRKQKNIYAHPKHYNHESGNLYGVRMPFKVGVRYLDGKILFFKNPVQSDNPSAPAWAIDIRELLAMFFVGIAALCLIIKGYIPEAMYLLGPMIGYAVGRTVPYPTRDIQRLVERLHTKEDTKK